MGEYKILDRLLNLFIDSDLVMNLANLLSNATSRSPGYKRAGRARLTTITER